jgi:hypothetical protein
VTKIINKFLDEYLGDEVNVVSQKMYHLNDYRVLSKKNTLIFSFRILKNGEYTIFRGRKSCELISRWFGITEDEAMRCIRDWFANKHNINKFSDLNKFIKEYDTTRT